MGVDAGKNRVTGACGGGGGGGDPWDLGEFLFLEEFRGFGALKEQPQGFCSLRTRFVPASASPGTGWSACGSWQPRGATG